jgi:hypothetical protein
MNQLKIVHRRQPDDEVEADSETAQAVDDARAKWIAQNERRIWRMNVGGLIVLAAAVLGALYYAGALDWMGTR